MHATSYEFWEGGTTPFVFRMVSTADHLTPVAGLSPTVTISKVGAAFAATDGVVSEIGNGWYKVVNPGSGTFLYGSSEEDGPYLLHATASGAVGSGVYVKTELWKGRSIAAQVFGASLGDYQGDDSVGVALWNALRGYQHTAGPGGSSAGVAEGTVGLKLGATGLDGIVLEALTGAIQSINARQGLQLILAASAGSREGAGTGTTSIQSPGGTARAEYDTPGDGNRTANSTSLTA